MHISDDRKKQLIEFQQKYDLNFKDIKLLNQAFVHTSYTYENNLDVSNSYERLEFLGDAVLKLTVSSIFYNNFPDINEGELTKIRGEAVSDKYIFEFAKKLGFEDLVLLGKNEKKHGGNKKESILACAFEAFLGAVYLEYKNKGYKKAYDFLYSNFLNEILDVYNNTSKLNPKAQLQEYTQAINRKLPLYKTVKEVGLEHDKTFFVEVSFENKIIGKGSAKSIKQAQQNAAMDALYKLNIVKEEK